jgi:hypothetical protein
MRRSLFDKSDDLNAVIGAMMKFPGSLPLTCNCGQFLSRNHASYTSCSKVFISNPILENSYNYN